MGDSLRAGFDHGALLYATPEEFLAGSLPFVGAAVERGEPVLVAVDRPKAALLRRRLGPAAEDVTFVDMRAVGGNPGALISLWRDYVTEHAAAEGTIWGLGEPAWPGRSAAELGECHRHECLLNLAFADEPRFRLLCSYDASGLGTEVIDAVRVSHPVVVSDGRPEYSASYAALDRLDELLAEPLPDPGREVEAVPFTAAGLPLLRERIAATARAAGLRVGRAEEAVLAINELATNSLAHGGGAGVLRSWREDDAVVWEVRDRGRIADPLAGRRRPPRDRPGGFGLWIANQVADLVQLRSSARGTVVRLWMRV